MRGEFYVATQFVAAAFLVILLVLLLRVRFASRVNRAFAACLLLQGLSILFAGFNHIAVAQGSTRWQAYWVVLQDHVLLALPPALGWFLLSYRPPSSAWLRRSLAVAALTLGSALQVGYLTDPCLVQCGAGQIGPLSPFAFGAPLAYGLAGLVLVHSAKRAPAGQGESAAFVVGSAFALNAIIDSGLVGARLLHNFSGQVRGYHPLAWSLTSLGVRLAGLVPAAILVLEGWRMTRRTAAVRHRGPVLLVLALLAVATPLVAEFLLPPEDPQPRMATFLYGLWRMALPAAVAYALVRHRLFGIDIHLRRGVVRGAVLVVFLGIFVSISKIAENYLSTFGIVVGGILAGLALLALSPLEKLGRRIADAVVPTAAPVEEMPAGDKLGLYASQVRLVWSDGAMGRKERILLDQLRDRLGIPFDVAARVEHEEAVGTPPPGQRKERKRPVSEP